MNPLDPTPRAKLRPVRQKGPMCDVFTHQEQPVFRNHGNHKSSKPNISLNPHYILFFLMFVVLAACFSMIRPYINTILLALILSVVVRPIHQRVEKAMGMKKNLAAFTSCFLLTIVVVIPLSFVLVALIHQGVSSFNTMNNWIAQGKYQVLLDHPLATGMAGWLQEKMPDIQKVFPSLDLQDLQLDKIIMKYMAGFGKQLFNQSGYMVANLGSLVAKFFLMIFVFFFVVRDEEVITDRFLHLFPLNSTQEERILTKIKEVAKSALMGTLMTSLAQGVAGGIAFQICGIPGLFWGTMVAFASLIPVVGTGLIWVPACLLLLVTGKFWLAAFILGWFVLVVGTIDNVLRPIFMQGGAEMSTLLIFLSILGGLSRFGLIGLLYGPLLFGLALVLIYIYNMEFKDFLSRQDAL